jgi:hypothetical protein
VLPRILASGKWLLSSTVNDHFCVRSFKI